jgi:hypothetical protein
MVPSVEPGLVRCWSSIAVMVFADAIWLEEPAGLRPWRGRSPELWRAALGDEDVGGLDIAMNDVLRECAASKPSAISMARAR